MKYFSMFSGIGGFESGIEKAYAKIKSTLGSDRSQPTPQHSGRPFCVGFSEIDKYATAIYQYHFPKHKAYGDAFKIDPGTIPDFDLLCGGFPCQAFSIAGKRGGFEDTRGTLFFEIARILAVKRPKFLLLENVKGLLSHDHGRTFGTILSTLSDLGYFLEWQVLNSKNFGVPQNRERVFIVGHFGGIGGQQVFPIGCSNEKDSEIIPNGEQRAQGIATRHLGRNGKLMSELASPVQVAETPHILQVNNPTHSNDRVYLKDGISPCLNTAGGGRRQPKIIDEK